MMDRCDKAIRFGVRLHTRCLLVAPHDGRHEGRGLVQFPHQRIEWFQGDQSEYVTDRDDEYAWEA
jgi:hypothetical protein